MYLNSIWLDPFTIHNTSQYIVYLVMDWQWMLCHFLGGTCNKAGFNRQGTPPWSTFSGWVFKRDLGTLPKNWGKPLHWRCSAHFPWAEHTCITLTLDVATKNKAKRRMLQYDVTELWQPKLIFVWSLRSLRILKLHGDILNTNQVRRNPVKFHCSVHFRIAGQKSCYKNLDLHSRLKIWWGFWGILTQ